MKESKNHLLKMSLLTTGTSVEMKLIHYLFLSTAVDLKMHLWHKFILSTCEHSVGVNTQRDSRILSSHRFRSYPTRFAQSEDTVVEIELFVGQIVSKLQFNLSHRADRDFRWKLDL